MDHIGPISFGVGIVLLIIGRKNIHVHLLGAVICLVVAFMFTIDLLSVDERPLAVATGLIFLYLIGNSALLLAKGKADVPARNEEEIALWFFGAWGAVNLLVGGVMVINSHEFKDYRSMLNADSGWILLEFSVMLGIVCYSSIKHLYFPSNPKKPTTPQN